MKHTPGPWTLTKEPIPPQADDRRMPVPYWFIDAGGGHYLSESGGFHIAGFLGEPDARLIAEAPEILNALKELCEQFRSYRSGWMGEGIWRDRIGLPEALNRAESIVANVERVE